MSRGLGLFLGAWALVATLALTWVLGRASMSQEPRAVTSTAATPVAAPASRPALAPSPAPSASPSPSYPDYRSTVPQAFRGRWDEMIADRCEGREARFYFGAREFANFEVAWEVTKVKPYSPTEIDLYTTMKDENANQVDEVGVQARRRRQDADGEKEGRLLLQALPVTGAMPC